MKVDAELMFECLIYINVYYYTVIATCDSIMTASKYRSIRDTPNIGQDACVVFVRLSGELLKIVLYRKFKDEKRNLITAVGVGLTILTIFSVLYTFILQDPVIKLEYMLCSITILLEVTEVFFGTWQLLLSLKKTNY